jgi:hypothetical protein
MKLSSSKINPIMYKNNDIEVYFPSHLFYVKIDLCWWKVNFGTLASLWYFDTSTPTCITISTKGDMIQLLVNQYLITQLAIWILANHSNQYLSNYVIKK